MTNRYILVLFLIGVVLTIGGAVAKIMHWEFASLLLIVGMTFEAAAGIGLIVKILRKNNNDGFLDS
jgi:hypothetical protein